MAETFDNDFLKAMKISGSALPEPRTENAVADSQASAIESFSLEYSLIGGSVVLAQEGFDELRAANRKLADLVRLLKRERDALRSMQFWLVWAGALIGSGIVMTVRVFCGR